MNDVVCRVRSLVQDAGFLRLTLMSAAKGAEWAKAYVRPVLIRGRRLLQFAYWDGRKEVSVNAEGAEADSKLGDALRQPFDHLHLQTAQGDLHVRVTRKGKPLVTWGKPSRPESQPCLEHNRRKDQPLAPGRPDPLLQALGIMAGSGDVRSSMRAKFHQINEFLRILEQALPPGAPAGLAVDCGCGAAYLTFAAWRWLRQERNPQARVEGVDANPDLVAKCERLRQSLQWEGPAFFARSIRDYAPPSAPDVVLSLHACGIATDEALAGAVKWGARVILAAPCCQHELQPQLSAPLFRPLLRHGILKERLADLLADAFRALALRIVGYRAEVIEFISPEHTARNVMIRAERTGVPGGEEAVREYRELRDYWGGNAAHRGDAGHGISAACASHLTRPTRRTCQTNTTSATERRRLTGAV